MSSGASHLVLSWHSFDPIVVSLTTFYVLCIYCSFMITLFYLPSYFMFS